MAPIIINRLAKLLGVLIKMLGYMFHFFFKTKRFIIPEHAKPLWKGKELRIPKIIWQTNYTNRVTLPVYINYLFNRFMSLDWEYRYVSTEARQEFIKANATQRVSSAFEQLTDGASQADFWRLFTLNNSGGVYMDIDAHVVWPLSALIKPDDEAVYLKNKEHYTNYFIASDKHNVILENALNLIVENIENKNIGRGVYDLTGPSVLNTAIGESSVHSRLHKYTCIQGSFTNEYFQYMDKPRGKWTHMDKNDLLKS
ncbi:MAG: glycosyltransferase [Sulfuricurvum sp.]|nr:glycosyltransferase [Sulfuricurvum sp.]